MPSRRHIRRLAMQLLYQIDLRGEEDLASIVQGFKEDDSQRANVQGQASALAQAAWENHTRADTLAGQLAPQWPTHRQPPVDRAILRLAFYEIDSGTTPPNVAINEAVELAKQYCSEQAPAFINGLLDKMAKQRSDHPDHTAADTPLSVSTVLGENLKSHEAPPQ